MRRTMACSTSLPHEAILLDRAGPDMAASATRHAPATSFASIVLLRSLLLRHADVAAVGVESELRPPAPDPGVELALGRLPTAPHVDYEIAAHGSHLDLGAGRGGEVEGDVAAVALHLEGAGADRCAVEDDVAGDRLDFDRVELSAAQGALAADGPDRRPPADPADQHVTTDAVCPG